MNWCDLNDLIKISPNEYIVNKYWTEESLNLAVKTIPNIIIKNDFDICVNCKINLKKCRIYYICRKCGLIGPDRDKYDDLFDYHYVKPYNTKKHFNNWWRKLNGYENNNIPPKLLNALSKVITPEMEYCEIRRILKKYKYNNYSNNVILIKYLITGVGQVQLNSKIYDILKMNICKIIKVYPSLKLKNKKNNLNIPYYIYKLLDLLLIDPKERGFLKGIHLQSNNTIKKNDKIWLEICVKLGLEFRKTL